MQYYAVHQGRKPGVYTSWKECQQQTSGYSGAKFKKFSELAGARAFYLHGNELHLQKPINFFNSSNTVIKPTNKIDKNQVKNQVQNQVQKTNKREEIDGIEVYTDGSLIRRGGKCYAGYGVYIPKLEIEKSYILKSPKTNNRAELSAIIKAIKLTKNQNLKLIIYTDSQYSIQIASGTGLRYQKNGFKTPKGEEVKNRDLVEKLLGLLVSNRVTFHHIRAHTGKRDQHSRGNDKADSLAIKGATGDLIKNLPDLGKYRLSSSLNDSLENIEKTKLLEMISRPNYLEECRRCEIKRLEYEVVTEYLRNLIN